jgi:hypothetical protein
MQGKTKKKDRHFFDGFPDDTFSLSKKKSFIPLFSNFSEMERKETTSNLAQVLQRITKNKANTLAPAAAT